MIQVEINDLIIKRLRKEKLSLSDYIILECISNLDSELFDTLCLDQENLLIVQKLYRQGIIIPSEGADDILYIVSTGGEELVNELFWLKEQQ